MNGLNAQPARRFNGAGKQLPRPGQSLWRMQTGFAQVCQGFLQCRVGFHRPFPQAVEQAVLHLACGGFGIGQAQNMLRLHATQQQAGSVGITGRKRNVRAITKLQDEFERGAE